METQRIIALTSIAPRNITVQMAAINTWFDVFDEVVSFNDLSEREILLKSTLIHGVSMVDCADFLDREYGRPYVSVQSILDYASKEYSKDIVVLLNSDIYVAQDIKNYLLGIEKCEVAYCNRVEHDPSELSNDNAYLNGIDLFAWRGETLRDLNLPKGFALGVPFWDLILPYAAVKHDIGLTRLPFDLTSHISHDQRWGDFYAKAGELAIEYATGLSLLEYQARVSCEPERIVDDSITDMFTRPLLALIHCLTIEIDAKRNRRYQIIFDEKVAALIAEIPASIEKTIFLTPYEVRSRGGAVEATCLTELIKQALTKLLIAEATDSAAEIYFDFREVLRRLAGDLPNKIENTAKRGLRKSADRQSVVGALFIPKIDELFDCHRRVVGFTSLFRSRKYIKGLLENIAEYQSKELLHWVVIDCNSIHQTEEADLVSEYVEQAASLQVTIVRLGYDPGLYNVWMNAIALTNSDYVTNINTDDLRSPGHVKKMVSCLDQNSAIGVACSALKVFREPNKKWAELYDEEVWFAGSDRDLSLADLFQIKKWRDGSPVGPIVSQNIPHCMPVWRRSLHEKYGYFDEKQYSSVADWEFWLRVANKGERIHLVGEPLGAYFWNPFSYNRVDMREKDAVQSILKKYCSIPTMLRMGIDQERAKEIRDRAFMEFRVEGELRLNVDVPGLYYGEHRTGWSFVVQEIARTFHESDSELRLEPFLEKKFGWGKDPGDINNDPKPIKGKWLGIAHVPPNVPGWFQSQLSMPRIAATELWRQSRKGLCGLISLTKYHSEYLKRHFDSKVPVHAIKHPTDLNVRKFSFEAYYSTDTPQLVQIGVWLRKMHGIGALNVKSHEKVLLTKPYVKEMLDGEAYVLNLDSERLLKGVRMLEYLTDEEYDELLSKSLVFCDFYDTSANNLVLEAIARHSPIVVPRHPAIVEYLGDDYPLYFLTYRDAAKKIEDRSVVKAAQEYLQDMPKLDLTVEYFLDSLKWFADSVRRAA